MADETPPTSASDSGSSQSDSDVPPETEECPSITAEAALDSDEDGDFLPVDKAGGVITGACRGFLRLGASVEFLTRYDGELREPLVWHQGSQVSILMAKGSTSLLSSHTRGIGLKTR